MGLEEEGEGALVGVESLFFGVAVFCRGAEAATIDDWRGGADSLLLLLLRASRRCDDNVVNANVCLIAVGKESRPSERASERERRTSTKFGVFLWGAASWLRFYFFSLRRDFVFRRRSIDSFRHEPLPRSSADGGIRGLVDARAPARDRAGSSRHEEASFLLGPGQQDFSLPARRTSVGDGGSRCRRL